MEQNERIRLKELDEFLCALNGEPLLFKHSNNYESKDWVYVNKCCTFYPVQRKLGTKECVFDLDHVSPAAMKQIPLWLESIGFKFQAWKTSTDGMHIHFWTPIEGKFRKKTLVQELSKKIEEMFNVKNDLGPMGHNHIRTEWSKHPRKGTVKVPLSGALSRLFFENDIDSTTREKVFKSEPSDPSKLKSNSGVRDGKCPTCIKYIMSHQFVDGRQRLMFVVASWFKSSCNGDDKEATRLTWEWIKSQNIMIPYSKVWSTVKSSNGTVGCRYRHDLLEELGIDMSHCSWEKIK